MIPRRWTPWLLLPALLAATPATPAARPAKAADPPAVSAAVLAELHDLVAAGRCDEALARLDTLAARRKDPDLLVLRGNCVLQRGRRTEQRFDAAAYDRQRLGRGRDVVGPGTGTPFWRTDVHDDPEALRAARGAFRGALAARPDRADLVVGNVALLAGTGAVDEALSVLDRHAGALDDAARDDLGRVVQDLLQGGATAAAARLAGALAERFPGSPAALRATGLVALAGHDTAAAIGAFTPLAAREPADVPLARELARLLLASRRWAEAVSLLAPIAERDDELLFWLGLAQMRAAPRPDAALPVFRALGERLRRAKTPPATLAKIVEHEARVVADPRRPTYAMRLRAADRFAGAGVLPAAIAELDDALAQQPGSVEARLRLAALLREAGFFDLALAELDAARSAGATAPGEIDAARGELLFGMARDAEAAAAFAAARGEGAPRPFAEALVAAARGQAAEARRLLEEAAAGTGETAEQAKARLKTM